MKLVNKIKDYIARSKIEHDKFLLQQMCIKPVESNTYPNIKLSEIKGQSVR